jgi:hypothetical protein
MNLSTIAVNGDLSTFWNQARRVLNANDTGNAEFAGDNGAMRQHAATLDHEAADEKEHRRPSGIGLSGDENVARDDSRRLAHIAQHDGAARYKAAAGTGARMV